MPTESDYKRGFRKLVGVWSEAYETRSGGGVGYPDLQLLVGARLLPVELKRGSVRNGFVWPERIRPAQIVWHHDFMEAGGIAHVLVCEGPVAKMDVWSLPSMHREYLAAWRRGYYIERCTQWVSQGKLLFDLERAFQIR